MARLRSMIFWLVAALTNAPATADDHSLVSQVTQLFSTGLSPRTIDGQQYFCKCYPDEPCWPASTEWDVLNNTVNGRLMVHVPPGAVCHDTFQGPLGTTKTYNAAGCADATANWSKEQWQVEKPAAALWTYFTNETCIPTTNASTPCTLGYYGVYVIMATKREHVKAGIDFARVNNLRLVIRNTGHDFLGRSVGWGSLVINTHAFQEITWIDEYQGSKSYSGGAVKLGAGIQAFDILAKGHARNPPVVVVTGECPTVGITGGFIQGGGHGPWTTLKGLSADNVLSFEAITAAGEFVTADEVSNPDLFWALKGGGPATYAAILSVTMRTFEDVKSAGATLYINTTLTTDPNKYWEGIRTFHKWSNHFVDNGLYVYFEIAPGFTFRIRPFVAIGKTSCQLQAELRPFLDELRTKEVPFEFAIKDFPTFYDLYLDLFEDEAAAQPALTGGWMFTHDDVAHRNDAIIDAFKTVSNPREDLVGIIVGHLTNPGHKVPISNSATHPAWRNASSKVIAVLPVPYGASLEEKADLQRVLAYKMDAALRNASRDGCAYVNEADPHQPNWQTHFWGSEYPRLKETRHKWDPDGVFYAVSTPGTEDWEVVDYGTRLCKKI